MLNRMSGVESTVYSCNCLIRHQLCQASCLRPLQVVLASTSLGSHVEVYLILLTGHWNHSFWWRQLAPTGTRETNYERSASPELKEAIAVRFGSVDNLKEVS